MDCEPIHPHSRSLERTKYGAALANTLTRIAWVVLLRSPGSNSPLAIWRQRRRVRCAAWIEALKGKSVCEWWRQDGLTVETAAPFIVQLMAIGPAQILRTGLRGFPSWDGALLRSRRRCGRLDRARTRQLSRSRP